MLADRDLRMTRQRSVILEELRKVTSHPTADEVYEMVRHVLPHISLGTVYRNLEILSETGAIQKLEVAGTQKRFDGNAMNHYHVRCIGCGRVDDLPMEPIQEVETCARGVCGYRIMGYRIEYFGLCPGCLKKQTGA